MFNTRLADVKVGTLLVLALMIGAVFLVLESQHNARREADKALCEATKDYRYVGDSC